MKKIERGINNMQYKITAEHCNGASVSHSCTTGIYSDPTDYFQEKIEANSEEEANFIGLRRLQQIVEDSEPCHCHRHLEPGYDSWWNSVSISIEQIEI